LCHKITGARGIQDFPPLGFGRTFFGENGRKQRRHWIVAGVFSGNAIGFASAELRWTAHLLASTVLPEMEWCDYRQNQKARNYLKLRAKLVAGVGFEPTTFRL
jgi:hypothetical protein